MYIYIYIYYVYTYIHTYIHIFCFAERLLQTLSAVRCSTGVGSRDRKNRAWPDRNVKSASKRTKGEKGQH